MKKILIVLTFWAPFVQAKNTSDSTYYRIPSYILKLTSSPNSTYKKQVLDWLSILKASFEKKDLNYNAVSHVVNKEIGAVMIRSFMVKYDSTSLLVNVCTSDTYLHTINPTMLVFGMPTNTIIMTSPPYVYNIIDREFIWDFLIKVLEKKFFYDKRKKMYIEI